MCFTRHFLRRTPVFLELLLALILAASAAHAGAPDLDQGWNKTEQSQWYKATQGSRLIPWMWFKSLEVAGSEDLFASDANLAKFRYLPNEYVPGMRLPVGFTIDNDDDSNLGHSKLRWKKDQGPNENWVGMNCAACHTAEMTYRGQRLRIDGGPTLADFQSFMQELNRALVATRDNREKFVRFADKVLRRNDSTRNRQLLFSALEKLIAWQLSVEHMNATPLRYGFGRLDAFGNIYNRTALLTKAENPTPNPSDAPTSYPFLWNTPQHDFVQWNGIAPNDAKSFLGSEDYDVGALGRNTGQVIGVFGDVVMKKSAGLLGTRVSFASSVNVTNLGRHEKLVAKLKPPKWPAELFGQPDPVLTAQGRTLFGEKCASCHMHLDRKDLKTKVKANISLFSATPDPNDADGVPPGTDIWMACNAFTYKSATGVLAGTPSGYYQGKALGSEAPIADILTAAVTGTLVNKAGDVIKSAGSTFFSVDRGPEIVIPSAEERSLSDPRAADDPKSAQRYLCQNTKDVRILGYKARPLTGIWATPPYLHNGSVPTLYDLLLPENDRPRSFYTGSREFDPIKVGYVTAQSEENAFLLETRDASGNPIDGNSNTGHDYGNAALTEDDRRALVEYMKTIGE